MSELRTAYIGIGASLGAREASVLGAALQIETLGVGRLMRLSSLYETDPVGMESDASFINAVAMVGTLLTTNDLLDWLKIIEKCMGRSAGHMQPREIDLDIISYGSMVSDSTDLTLPHPRYRGRAFVLVPLAEVAPGFVCPSTGSGIVEMLAATDTAGVVRISSHGWVGGALHDN